MQFDPPTIHNLAAEMFWRMAEECGVGEIGERVLKTQGRCLLENRFDGDLWAEYPLASLPEEEVTRVLNAVALEAFTYARDEENMIGQVVLEDDRTGRSPSAANIDTRPLAAVPIVTSNRPIERLGRLCIRHPLPAVVFASRPPSGSLVRVEDTATALGFDMPMFLMPTGHQQVGDRAFLLVGYFFVPVPNVEAGDLWSHVIQNSTRNVQGVTLHGPDGECVIRYTWPT